jgi:hypothetical protein
LRGAVIAPERFLLRMWKREGKAGAAIVSGTKGVWREGMVYKEFLQ